MKDYKKKEIEYEKKVAINYNSLYHSSSISQKYDLDFIKFIKKDIKPGAKILDLGCGPASLWPYFIKYKKTKFIGADISPEMIKLSKKQYPKEEFIVCDSEKLPFKNEEFDVVIVSSMLHHLPKTKKTFVEIRRVLKTYGKLIGREPQEDYFMNETSPWISGAVNALGHMVQRKSGRIIQSEPKIHEFHHSFNLNDFVQNLRNYFVVKKIISKYPFSSAFNKNLNKKLVKLLLDTDDFLNNFKGNQFFYLAIKDGFGKKEILGYIDNYLMELNNNKIPPKKFIKRFIWLTKITDQILGKNEIY